MKRVLLLVLSIFGCASTARAACDAALYGGAESVITRGEKGEYATGRASIACALPARLAAFSRLSISGTQDGGALDYSRPESFRAVETVLGLRRAFGPVRLSALAGTTWSAEGKQDAPADARLHTLGGTVGAALGDGGYVELGAAYDQRVGGPALLAALNLPVKGAYTVLDASVPLNRTALQQRAFQLRVGAQVRLKRLAF